MAAAHRRLSVSRRQLVQGAGVAGLGLLAGCGRWPGQAPAPAKVPRLGILAASDASNPDWDALRAGLQELGYVDGQNIGIVFRSSDGDDKQLPSLAAELVSVPVDLIVTEGTGGTAAARGAGNLPIVMAQSGDPVGAGLVANLARPGGTITGLSSFAPVLGSKRLELLKETVPGLTRVGVPWIPTNPVHVIQVREIQEAGEASGVQVLPLEVHGGNDLEPAFHAATREGAAGLIVFGDTFFQSERARTVALAAQSHLPVIYNNRQPVDAGGLMAYGPSRSAMFRRGAYYVDRILRGTPPAELPVEQPTTFEFVINLKTAQALGLTIPQHVLLQATEIIQ
jgi:putative ABC transport system substrate-binding protein